MIASLILASIRNRFLVLLATVMLTAWGLWAVRSTPLDALPDLSDVLEPTIVTGLLKNYMRQTHNAVVPMEHHQVCAATRLASVGACPRLCLLLHTPKHAPRSLGDGNSNNTQGRRRKARIVSRRSHTQA